MNLQEKVYSALCRLSLPVVKYLHEYSGEYPVLVYREISNTPALHGDNKELTRRVMFQISIGTENDEPAEIESAVEKIMCELGFMRVDSQDIFDEIYWRTMRFITVEVSEIG